MRIKAFLLLILVLLFPLESQATRLFTCGIEEGVLGIGVAIWDTTGGNAPAATSGVPPAAHSGTYRMTTSAVAGISTERARIANVATSGTYYTRFYIKANDATPSADATIASVVSNGIVTSWSVSLLTTGVIRLTNVAGGSTTTDGATVLSDNTWYRVEVRHVVSDTIGEIEVKLFLGDSTTALDDIQLGAVNVDTLGTNVHYVIFGKNASTTTFSYDDMAVNDTTGSFQTSWPGPGKVYMLVPDSDISNSWEDTATTNPSLYTNVDDMATPGTPDDTNYNKEDDTLTIDDEFGMTNLGSEVPVDATLSVFAVYGRVGSTGTSSTLMRYNIWDESHTEQTGPNLNANVNGWKINIYNDHNVMNISTKSKANIDSFHVGYTNITDTAVRERRVSAIWANVEWLEAVAPPAGNAHNSMLLGVGP